MRAKALKNIADQAKDLLNLDISVKIQGTCEWDVHALAAYDVIHNSPEIPDEIANMSKDKLLKILRNYTFSNSGKTALEFSDAIVEKYFAGLMPEYCRIVENFIADYKKLFPKHVSDDVDRMCRNMFSGLYAVVVAYAQRNGLFEMPSKNCYCDVMLQR